MIKVMVVDDHTIFRSGIQRLIMDESDIRVTAEASNCAEALAILQKERFDILLLDINMEGRSGLELISILADTPATRVPTLVLSMYPESQYALLAIQGGAQGYISKDANRDELIAAIRLVAAGRQYLSPTAAQLVHEQLRGNDQRPLHQQLSVREHQIMLMLLKGMSLTEIGHEMMISVKTVSTHRTRILEKLSVSSTAGLVLYAVRNNLVD